MSNIMDDRNEAYGHHANSLAALLRPFVNDFVSTYLEYFFEKQEIDSIELSSAISLLVKQSGQIMVRVLQDAQSELSGDSSAGVYVRKFAERVTVIYSNLLVYAWAKSLSVAFQDTQSIDLLYLDSDMLPDELAVPERKRIVVQEYNRLGIAVNAASRIYYKSRRALKSGELIHADLFRLIGLYNISITTPRCH